MEAINTNVMPKLGNLPSFSDLVSRYQQLVLMPPDYSLLCTDVGYVLHIHANYVRQLSFHL